MHSPITFDGETWDLSRADPVLLQKISRALRATTSGCILTIDPGSVNFAWAVTDIDTRIVLARGMLPVQMTSVDRYSIQGCAVVIEGLMYEWQHVVKRVVWERYQTRGRGSKNNETVNLVCGMIAYCAMKYGLQMGDPVMPSMWKGWWNRRSDVKDPWYEVFAGEFAGMKKKDSVHMMDACGIGRWYIETQFEKASTAPLLH